MKDEFAPRNTVSLPAHTAVTHPEELPELVHLNDPATAVFTDFTREHPMTIGPDASVRQALKKMKNSGICVLLVVDENKNLLGEITSDEIMGEKPVRMAKSSGIEHGAITVRMIMTPADKIHVLEYDHLRGARVGHIIATLKSLESRHVLVLENGSIRGLYRAGQISQQLGYNILDDESPAHNLAEIVHSLG